MDYSQTHVKLYLLQHSAVKEIRRVMLSNKDIESFQTVQIKLEEIFPQIKGTEYNIYWKDSDNENIVIRNESEWKIAMKPTIYQKFYINILSGCQEKSESFTVVHDKVFCDVCGKQVNGYRYKCLQCDDYDLCEQCEQQHFHSEHLMLRVGQSNVSARKIRELPMYLRCFFFGEHQDCRYRHGDKSEHRGKRGKRNHKKHSRSSDLSGSDEEDEHCKEKKRRRSHIPRCAKSFMDFIQNYEMFLNPSGNGVEGRPETTTRVSVETSPGMLNFIENVISSIFEPAEVAKSDTTRKGESDQKSQQNDIGNQSNEPTETESAVNQISEKLASQNISDEPNSTESLNEKETAPEKQEVSTSSNGQGEQKTEAELAMDPKVVLALSQMMSMGFKNEGNSLLSLIQEKDGDIPSVLECLENMK